MVPSIYEHYRQRPPSLFSKMQKLLCIMWKGGMICNSTSPWAPPWSSSGRTGRGNSIYEKFEHLTSCHWDDLQIHNHMWLWRLTFAIIMPFQCPIRIRWRHKSYGERYSSVMGALKDCFLNRARPLSLSIWVYKGPNHPISASRECSL